jgi:hypothetical protein
MTRRSLFGFLRGLRGMFDHLLLWNFRGADADSFRWRPWQCASQRRMLDAAIPHAAGRARHSVHGQARVCQGSTGIHCPNTPM